VTAGELISLLLRRWYVAMLCGALTAAGALVLLERPPVYFAQFELALLPPLEPTNPNTLHRDPYGITPMAGLMVVEFNRGKHPLDMSTTETTLYGEELTRGHRVRMRNVGNQWQPVYRDPVIDVQVVDPDPERARSEVQRIRAELAEILRRRQVEMKIRPAAMMTLQPAPADPVVQEVSGSRPRVLVGLAMLGGTTSLLAVIWVERLSRRRRGSDPSVLMDTGPSDRESARCAAGAERVADGARPTSARGEATLGHR
jgi:hypothetical protein